MPSYRSKRTALPSAAAQRWERLANIQFPVVSGWAQRTAVNQLVQLARAGDQSALRLCAKFLMLYDDPEIHSAVHDLFISLRSNIAIDILWDVYASNHRPAVIRELLLELDQPARHPPEMRALSLLVLNKKNTERLINEDLIPALVIKREDKDPLVAERARNALSNLKRQDAINALCKLWMVTRDATLAALITATQYHPTEPLRAVVYTALLTNHPEWLTPVIAEAVPILIDAMHDVSPALQHNAGFLCASLPTQPSVDVFCQQWADTRSSDLEDILVRAKYTASAPLSLRLLTRAKVGASLISETTIPEAIAHLLQWIDEPDPIIQTNVQQALSGLQDRAAVDEFCRLALNQNHARALKIATEAGYAPIKIEDRALFYYLTGQYAAYDALDFDRRVLRALYTAAAPELRKRISRKIQSAGRPEDLEILSSAKSTSARPEMGCDEADLLIDIHINHQSWDQLWQLLFDLPLTCAARALEEIFRSEWLPGEQDIVFYNELKQIHASFAGQFEKPAFAALAMQSQIRVSGRINDLSFSPVEPLLTIASGSRSIVRWNYQEAVIAARMDNLAHSAYRVESLPSGEIIWGERAAKRTEPCSVWLWNGKETRKLNQHLGSVTALLVMGDRTLITSGADMRVCQLDVFDPAEVSEINLSRTFRTICNSPDEKFLYLLDEMLHSVRLEDFKTGGRLVSYPLKTPGTKRSIAQQCGTDSTGQLWVGLANGQIIIFSQKTGREAMQIRSLVKNDAKCSGLIQLPTRSGVAVAWLNGDLNLFTESLELLAAIKSPWQNITSVHASPDGAFLALGSRENGISLWDLRIQDFSNNWNRPISAQPAGLITLLEQWQSADNIASQTLKWMRLLQACLQYHYRFEVQIDVLTHVKPGAYDILL